MIYSDLMTTIDDDRVINKVDSMKHAQEGKQYLQENEIVNEFYIKTITLHKIFDDVKAPRLMDFLSLDVEGTEFEVLNGINFSIYNFKYIMVESRNDEQLIDYLKNKDYFFLKKISKRDLIFKYKKF